MNFLETIDESTVISAATRIMNILLPGGLWGAIYDKNPLTMCSSDWTRSCMFFSLNNS